MDSYCSEASELTTARSRTASTFELLTFYINLLISCVQWLVN